MAPESLAGAWQGEYGFHVERGHGTEARGAVRLPVRLALRPDQTAVLTLGTAPAHTTVLRWRTEGTEVLLFDPVSVANTVRLVDLEWRGVTLTARVVPQRSAGKRGRRTAFLELRRLEP